MARSWQYPRWRRTLMQGTMVLTLAATIGLAELVTRQRSRPVTAGLDQSATIENVTVKLPANWDLNDEDPDVLIAREPRPDGQGRIVIIRVKRLNHVMRVEDFLKRSGILNGTVMVQNDQGEPPDDSVAMEAAPLTMHSIPMAGGSGVMTHVVRVGPMIGDMSPSLHNQFIAAVVLPSRLAIVLQLDSTEPDTDGEDAKVVEQMAAAIQVAGEK